MVTLLNRNTDESPCSPITQAWMLRGWTPHSLANFSPNRSVSSEVPEPRIDIVRSSHRRTRYSVSTSSGLVTTITTRGSPPGLDRRRGLLDDGDVGVEHVESGLARLDVVTDGHDHHVLGLELVVAAAADLGARQQRQRVQVVERLATRPDAGAVVQRHPTGEALQDQRARGGDADAARPDDAHSQPGHAGESLRGRTFCGRARRSGSVDVRVGVEVEVGVEVALVERIAEPTKRDADPGLGGAEGDLVLFGDLAGAEAPDPGEHDGAALLHREIGERVVQPFEVVVQRDDVARVPCPARAG